MPEGAESHLLPALQQWGGLSYADGGSGGTWPGLAQCHPEKIHFLYPLLGTNVGTLWLVQEG